MKVGGLTNMICKRIGAKYSKFVKICAPEGWREGFNSDGLDNLEKPGWMFWTALWGALYLVGSMFPYVPFVNGRYADVLLSEIGFFAVVALSSIFVPLALVIALLYVLRCLKVISWNIDLIGAVKHLSNCVGLSGVVGFLAVAAAPFWYMISGSRDVAFSSVMFDGSALLKFPAGLGVVGLVVGLCTACCHLISDVSNLIYKYVVPTVLLDVWVLVFFVGCRWDPFSLGYIVSEKYLHDRMYNLGQVDNVTDIGASLLGHQNFHIIVARHFSELGGRLVELRWISVIVVISISLVGAFQNVRKEIGLRKADVGGDH